MVRALFALLLLAAAAVPVQAAAVFFVQPEGTFYAAERQADTLDEALTALVAGPNAAERSVGIISAIPAYTRVLSVSLEGDHATVNLGGPGMRKPVDDMRADTMLRQIDWTARGFGVTLTVLVNGLPSGSIRYPAPTLQPGPVPAAETAGVSLTGSLSGKSITVNPGHGYRWTGNGYNTQRPVYCAPLNEEDHHNVEIARYLYEFLKADGATLRTTRELDLNRGNHPASGIPWWQLGAYFYLYDKGYPESIYSSVTHTIPGDPSVTFDQLWDDLRSRCLMFNYVGTDIMVSIHTNGLNGDCYGASCPTGMDMFRDSQQMGGPAVAAKSYTLATYCQDSIAAAIHEAYDATFPCRNGCNPRDGAYTDTYYAMRPTCFVELGFHDSCDTDAIALRDNVFRSSAMWGYYQGICQYYGVTPTWDLRSYEVVSVDIPDMVKGGSQFTAQITLRNRGCVWNEEHQFRLAAVEESDPFTTALRHNLAAQVEPGQTVTFQIPMTAPAEDGAYLTDWRMAQDERGVLFGQIISRSVTVDGEPPTPPAPVSDGGPYQTSLTEIAASWAASADAGSGLERYEYRVTDSQGGEPVGWTSAGLETSAVISFPMTAGVKYLVWVKAVDKAGWESPPAVSGGVTGVPVPDTIGVAKMLPDGTPVTFQGKIVTARFAGHLYICEPDRSSGVRVTSTADVAPGLSVDVTGTMGTQDSERVIGDTTVSSPVASPGRPLPLDMTARDLGGSGLGLFTAGAALGRGLHNVGLLVRLVGKVASNAADGFRIDDGTLLNDGSGLPGVWVECGTLPQPPAGSYAIVCGIAALDASGVRKLRVERLSDIQY